MSKAERREENKARLEERLAAELERSSFELLRTIYESQFGKYDGPDNAMPPASAAS